MTLANNPEERIEKWCSGLEKVKGSTLENDYARKWPFKNTSILTSQSPTFLRFASWCPLLRECTLGCATLILKLYNLENFSQSKKDEGVGLPMLSSSGKLRNSISCMKPGNRKGIAEYQVMLNESEMSTETPELWTEDIMSGKQKIL